MTDEKTVTEAKKKNPAVHTDQEDVSGKVADDSNEITYNPTILSPSKSANKDDGKGGPDEEIQRVPGYAQGPPSSEDTTSA